MFIYMYDKFELKVFLHHKVYKSLQKYLETIFFFIYFNIF